MLIIKKFASMLLIAICILLSSCYKDKSTDTKSQTKYINRLAQEPDFRIGKWYSISDGKGFGFTRSPLLDTIWFISDSIAGWTGRSPNPNSNEYVFTKTFFPDVSHIASLFPNSNDPFKVDTVLLQCNTTFSGDTFSIFWQQGWGMLPFQQSFLKK
jgi:hypothetical protein